MKNAGAGSNTATYNGYLILQSLGNKYDGNNDPNAPEDTGNASALAVALLACMNIGTGTAIPAATTFGDALGVYGAFGVRGLSASDKASVFTHDQMWVLQPPSSGSKQTWQAITNLSTGITDSRIFKAILIFAVRSTLTGTAFTNDQLINPVVIDWATIPPATFTSDLGGVIVGECVSAPSFMQHQSVGNGAEVLNYVDPDCPGDFSSLELPARSFAERVWRALSPEPAAAATAKGVTTGSGKGSLSPYGVVNPGGNNLGFTKSPSTKTNVINQPLRPIVTLANTTNAGTPFKQTFMLSYLKATANLGTPGQICFNWAYSDADGNTSFPLVQITKAGGYNLVATTAGTLVSPDGTLQPVPQLSQTHGAISPAFQLKNGAVRTTACPSYDGTFYYPDIVGDPTNRSQTFPPFDYPQP
ncbi:MAG: hypothetical protein ACTHQQ_00845 [Solirubrobacteraceae bacterium]